MKWDITDVEIKIVLNGINNGYRSKSELVQYCRDQNLTIVNYTDKVYHLSMLGLIRIEAPLSGGSYDLIDWQSVYLTDKGEDWLQSHSEKYIVKREEDSKWEKRETNKGKIFPASKNTCHCGSYIYFDYFHFFSHGFSIFNFEFF